MGLSQVALITVFFAVMCTHFGTIHPGSAPGLWTAVLMSELPIDQMYN